MTIVLIVVLVLLVLGTGTALIVGRGVLARRSSTGTLQPPHPEAGASPPAPTAPPPLAEPPTAPEAPARSPGAPPLVEPLAELPLAEAPRLRDRLGRSRGLFSAPFAALARRGKLEGDSLEELEDALILADVGLATTQRLLDDLRGAVRRGEVAAEPDALAAALKAAVVKLFDGEDRGLVVGPGPADVWLFVGVNGVGKTTTIGKLAARERRSGRSVVLAAGDTFRAAAADQLQLWAEGSGAGFVRGAEGADPSSVIFDAIQHAAARGADLVLADSAGRLHTKVNLMEELRKVRRVADRPPGHVREVLLVLDATTGQNGLVQARQFMEAVEVTGIVLTKLDGTAKGGIVLAIRSELGLPIKLVGVGEGIDDLVEFDPVEFADALFDRAPAPGS